MARPFVIQLLLLVCAVVVSVVQSNVIGIDLASDSMKVAIVQPGTPLEIGMCWHYCYFSLVLS